MERLRAWTAGQTGWRRPGLAVGLGVVATASLPPLHLVLALVPALVGLVWLIDAAPDPRRAFAAGWWWGLGYFATSLYWIAFALLTEPERFGWLVPVAVLGLGAVVAVFPALAAAGMRAAGAAGAGRILVFGVLWTAFEWVRSWIFTGFPWNLMGSVWLVSDAMIQVAAVAGVYGLGLVTVTVAAMPAVLADRLGGEAAPRRTIPVIAAFAVLGLVWAGGLARLAGAATGDVPGVRLRLVQPAIPQKLKWKPDFRDRYLARQLRMSVQAPAAGTERPTHVIWAETAATFFLASDPDRRAAMAGAVPPGGLIITGALRMTPEPSQSFRIWNSLHAVDSQGRIAATYDKAHLVPFGEYVPFRGLLKFSKLTAGRRDFSQGPGRQTLALPGLPAVSPLICYEAIFPGRVTDPRNRPHWLLNITNDSWFGRSAGPYQHFAAARMRAVEEGLPLVRVANAGISGVVDAHGRVVTRLGLGHEGIIDTGLPRRLEKATPYARLGDWMVFFVLLATGGAGLLMRPPGGT